MIASPSAAPTDAPINAKSNAPAVISILLKKNSDIISISDETSEDNRTLTKAAS